MFRDLKPLGKSNGRKWFQIWQLLLIKSVKLPRKKNVFWPIFFLLSRVILVLVFLTMFIGLFAHTSRSPTSKLFRFLESLGKSSGRKWSQIWKLFLIILIILIILIKLNKLNRLNRLNRLIRPNRLNRPNILNRLNGLNGLIRLKCH